MGHSFLRCPTSNSDTIPVYYLTANALLPISGCPTPNALLRIAVCPTPNALLRIAVCPTANALLCMSVPYSI